MLIARQVPPEWQESPLDLRDLPDTIAIFGNRHYEGHIPELFRRLFGDNPRDFTDEEILTTLHRETGKEWVLEMIKGSTPSEWQMICYIEKEWDYWQLDYLEVEYFNTGVEWEVWESDTQTTYPGEAEILHTYTHEWTDEDHRAEIAEEFGISPEDVTLLKFKGWIRTPEWEEG